MTGRKDSSCGRTCTMCPSHARTTRIIALLLALPSCTVAYLPPIPQTALSLERGTFPALDTRPAPAGTSCKPKVGVDLPLWVARPSHIIPSQTPLHSPCRIVPAGACGSAAARRRQRAVRLLQWTLRWSREGGDPIGGADHPGGNPGANLKSISHRFYLICMGVD